jgi:hypothetical protein
MNYIDGFVAAVPNANLDAYKKHATDASVLFKEHGALSVVGGFAVNEDQAGMHEIECLLGQRLVGDVVSAHVQRGIAQRFQEARIQIGGHDPAARARAYVLAACPQCLPRDRARAGRVGRCSEAGQWPDRARRIACRRGGALARAAQSVPT